MNRTLLFLAFMLFACFGSVIAQRAPAPTQDIAVYFSPDGGAADAIIKELNTARREIKVMAYSFTHADIAQAIAKANGLCRAG